MPISRMAKYVVLAKYLCQEDISGGSFRVCARFVGVRHLIELSIQPTEFVLHYTQNVVQLVLTLLFTTLVVMWISTS